METLFRYLAEAETNPWGISVNTCGHQVIGPGDLYPPSIGHPATHLFTWEKGRSLENIHILYVVSGEGDFETGHEKKRLQPGDIVLLFPGEWHRYRPDKTTGWEEYWIGFKGPLVDKFLVPELFAQKTSYKKNIGYHEEIIYLFQHALALAQRKSIGFQKILTGMIWQLAAYIASPDYRPKVWNSADQLVKDTVEHILLNVKMGVDFPMFARQSGLSYSHFCKMIKDKTGVSPQQLLINERIKLAKQLLSSTSLSVSEISAISGFELIYYFSKIFKSKVGITPTEWRKSKAEF